jgi:hypothetical protein
MAWTNETLILSAVRLLSGHDKQIRCLTSIEIHIRTHLIVAILMHAFFCHISIALSYISAILILISARFRNLIHIITSNISFQQYAPERRYSYVFSLLIKEAISVCVYVLLASLYKWFGFANNNYHITSMNVRRWLVESSYAPFIIFALLTDCYFGWLYAFDEYQLFSIIGMTQSSAFFLDALCRQPT